MSIYMVPMIARPDFEALETDWIPSIEEMDQAITELQTKVREFAAETFPQLVDVPEVQGWLTAWNNFVNDANGIADELWINRWQRRSDILALRARFNALVEWWKRLPGARSNTTTPQYKPEQLNPTSELAGVVKWAAIGLVAVAAIAAIGQLAGLTKLLPKGRA